LADGYGARHLVIRLDIESHRCYVGRELQKAEECLVAGRRYQMD
tara:strand:- start:382 stop:513 length:132 start_codon:yes stop_codon:yes gene_type:complete